MELKDAVDRLRESLKYDPDYYITWQANIAAAFQDEFSRVMKNKTNKPSRITVHSISNEAAKNFLNLLMR